MSANAKFSNVRPIFAGTGGYKEADPASAVYEAASPPPPWAARFQAVPPDWYTSPAPQREYLLRDLRHDRAGVLARGIVGQLIAEGGAGKTQLLCQLGHTVATAGTWIGSFDVHQAGRVLLILGEEDADETRRRLRRAQEADLLGRTPPAGSIIVAPLHGITAPMISKSGEDAPFLIWLRDFIVNNGPFDLIIIDPLSRFGSVFGGKGAEQDNDSGTRFIQGLESLAVVTGATVIVAAHINKVSRGEGATVNASSGRGSTSIGDGARWTLTLTVVRTPDNDDPAGTAVNKTVVAEVKKSNVAREADAISLRFNDDGALVPLEGAELQAARDARQAASPRVKREKLNEERKVATNLKIDLAVLSVVAKNPGLGTVDLKTHVAAAAGCSQELAGIAIARVKQAGRIHVVPSRRTKGHHLVDGVTAEAPASPSAPPPTPNETSNTTASTRVVPDDIDEHMIEEQLAAIPPSETPKTETSPPTSVNGVAVEKPAADVYDFLNPYGDS